MYECNGGGFLGFFLAFFNYWGDFGGKIFFPKRVYYLKKMNWFFVTLSVISVPG